MLENVRGLPAARFASYREQVLGPTRAREAWLKLQVDGKGLADAPPMAADSSHHRPRLTLPMAAAIQGSPADWRFWGRKTAAYRQIGNAFPPPVALAGGHIISSAVIAARDLGRRSAAPVGGCAPRAGSPIRAAS
jgi:DNA (cytosine-5)-methyltransferase 1